MSKLSRNSWWEEETQPENIRIAAAMPTAINLFNSFSFQILCSVATRPVALVQPGLRYAGMTRFASDCQRADATFQKENLFYVHSNTHASSLACVLLRMPGCGMRLNCIDSGLIHPF